MKSFGIDRIMEMLPHRFPFLLVDKVLETEGGKHLVAIKNVTMNEPFFVGHFPEEPVMPGVLLIEAMAQTGGILLLNSLPNFEEKLVFFMKIDKAKFRKTVVPGDQLFIEVELLSKKSTTFIMAGKVYVENVLVAEAEFMAGIVDRPKKAEE